MAADVFVSYSRRDHERVQGWLERLQAAGVSVWIDVRAIQGASLWGQEIVDAIEQCRVFMLMLSEASAASAQVVKEVSLAAESNRPILPLLLDPVAIPNSLRYHLAGLQHIELFNGDPGDRLQAILASLANLSGESQTEDTDGTLPAPADHGVSRVFLLKEQFSPEQMRERAWDQKMTVFGGLMNLIFRPRSEEIQLGQSEKRYEPFWHASARTHYVYEHDRQFVVSTSGPQVKEVTIEGQPHPIRNERYVALCGTEHCEEQLKLEACIDGLTGERRTLQRYLAYPRRQLPGLRRLSEEGGTLRAPVGSASAVVRQLLSELVRPGHAHRVIEDRAEIVALDLYFRPVYVFEYRWAVKGRNAVAEFDGLTGEMSPGGALLHGQSGPLPPAGTLFDVGREAFEVTLAAGAPPLTVRFAGPDAPDNP